MSWFIKEGQVFVNIAGEILPTRDPELIGNAVLDSLDKFPVEKDQLIERFKFFLLDSGKKRTPERFAVLCNIVDTKKPFNANTIHRNLCETFRVTRSTVYNTLQLLLECNIIKRTSENQNGELFKTTYFELN